jgi:hypothetical protein
MMGWKRMRSGMMVARVEREIAVDLGEEADGVVVEAVDAVVAQVRVQVVLEMLLHQWRALLRLERG